MKQWFGSKYIPSLQSESAASKMLLVHFLPNFPVSQVLDT
uniref:Uncharacterized protein n=1 Tax=Rhizophora mucronata TaxID=61149 RepID=A0A2P2IIR7_RHIMU